MANEDRVAIPGSAPKLASDSYSLSPVPPSEPIDVTVVLRRNPSLPEMGEQLLAGYQPESREEAGEFTSASPADVAAVEQFASEHRLAVTSANPSSRTIKLTGTASQFEQAFRVQLSNWPEGRAYSGDLTVPCDLGGVILAVLGLDSRPVARSRVSAV